ncbi:hypothetical protein [Streptomyces marincola]|uniref:Glutamine--fructose-6-phosphate aminotransferase [isomerizing] n=1 Tax=Streptomyces marincola TaxID=2878388 RepID=A0A1W7CW42_9ACTN|nr:hypothetical protein [Streptomyces marincola]ARQ69018.1 hypothetical protein CAG99_09215 [Streptomyces marincola]
MCGMVGYAGAQAQSALDVVLAGLGGLEQADGGSRGSAGVVVLSDGCLATAGATGPLAALHDELARRPLPLGGSAVGQLRCASGPCGAPGPAAGPPAAQPSLDAAGRGAVVYQGTLDNGAELRAALAGRGHRLASGTDSEVVAHLLAEAFSSCVDLGEALRQVSRVLVGRFAVIAVHADEPETVAGVQRGLPLFAGVGDGESFLASHAEALDGRVREVVELRGDDLALLRRESDEVRCEVTDAGGSVVRA